MRERTAWNTLEAVGFKTFGLHSDIGKSIAWLRSHPGEYAQRIGAFDYANSRLNELIIIGQFPPTISQGPQLKAALRSSTLPSIESIRNDFGRYPGVSGAVGRTLQQARFEYPDWAIIDPDYPSPATPAMGVLVEGFGLYLGKYIYGNKPEFRDTSLCRIYVLAFEEALLAYQPTSPLVRDLIGYIADEQCEFSALLHPLIDKLSREMHALH